METVELYPPLVMSGGSDFHVCSVNFFKNKFRETPKLEVRKSVASVVAKTSSAKTIPSRVILSVHFLLQLNLLEFIPQRFTGQQ